MVHTALEAAENSGGRGISAEVIDLRTLVPLDMATIAASVSKTHRVLIAHEAVQNGGVGAESLPASVRSYSTSWTRRSCESAAASHRFPSLRKLERALLPGNAELVRAVRQLMGLAG